jgi:tetratricopeptide (TPR) repeat protein
MIPRKKTPLLLLLLSLIVPAKSQTLTDSSLYNKGIRLIQKATTEKDYLSAASYFTSVQDTQKDWLTLYYAGLCYIHASMKATEGSARDKLIDKAQPMIDKAFKLKPGDSEIHVLQAFLYQARIQINPVARGMSYSGKAEASLKKAIAANPGNPRAYSLMAYNLFHTPALFGGGPPKALPVFLKAREKFIIFKPLLPFYPRWGELENEEMITACNEAMK